MTKPTLSEAIERMKKLLKYRTMTPEDQDAFDVVREAAENLANRDAFMQQGSFWRGNEASPLKGVVVEYANGRCRRYSRTEAELMFGVEPQPAARGGESG